MPRGIYDGNPFLKPDDERLVTIDKKIEGLKASAENLTQEEKAIIISEATRGCHPSNIKPEYQNLIIQIFLNFILYNGSISTSELCTRAEVSPLTYYKLMQGKLAPSVTAWMEGLNKTILSTAVLPLMIAAKKQAAKGSGKHLELILNYLGVLDPDKKPTGNTIQFIDKFIKADGGSFTSQTATVNLPPKQANSNEEPTLKDKAPPTTTQPMTKEQALNIVIQ